MKYLIIVSFLFLSGCSGYTIASLTSNIVTYSATGKTNSDHAMSFVTGKDCRIERVFKKKENYCEEKKLFIVENEAIENFDEKEINETIQNFEVVSLDIIKNDSNLIVEKNNQNIKDEKISQLVYVEVAFNKLYYGSLTWAEDQLTKGTKVSDKIGLTENLTMFVEETFDNYFY